MPNPRPQSPAPAWRHWRLQAGALLLAAVAAVVSVTVSTGGAGRVPRPDPGPAQATRELPAGHEQDPLAVVAASLTSLSRGDAATLTWGPLQGTRVGAGAVAISMEAGTFAAAETPAALSSAARLLAPLHPGFLRVGANTGDHAALTRAGLTRLAQLAAQAGTTVVLTLPMDSYNPAGAAAYAKLSLSVLGSRLRAVEIGNEPDAYTGRTRGRDWTWSRYVTQRDAYLRALTAAGVRLPLWGPDNAGPDWLGLAAAERPQVYRVLTPHLYALDGCHAPAPTPAELISGTEHQIADEAAVSFHAAAERSGLPVVVGEANNIDCGGHSGVSDRAVASFWALDNLLLQARAGTRAIAFHIGLSGCDGYSPICQPANGHGRAQRADPAAVWRPTPEYAALRLASSLEGEQFLRSQLYGRGHNMRAYVLTNPTGELSIVVEDLDPLGARPVALALAGPLRGPVQVGAAITAAGYTAPAVATPQGTPVTLARDTVTLRPCTALELTAL